MKTVAIVLFPDVQALDVSGPLDVFAEANAFIADGHGYRLCTLATVAGPVRASNGQRLHADAALGAPAQPSLEPTGPFDIVLVAGGPALAQAPDDPVLSGWLRAMAPATPVYGSICTGAFLLGRAGLLDGKRATTHWSDAAQLAAQFPRAHVEHDRIHVRDGTLVTSAGVTAGIDLALALVAADHGPAIALAVAKRLLVVAQRQGGQSQFSPYLDHAHAPDGLAAMIGRHVMAHLAETLPVERLADVAGMSARHFARQFVKEAGVTPAEFVTRARIDAARNLLEGSALPLKTVAYRCGFGSAARMRLVFAERFGVSPLQYRDQFCRRER